MEAKREDVCEAIRQDARFTILSSILETTGIGEAMSHEREAFTLFAPTDSAFRQLSERAFSLLTSPEGSGLAALILGQHLIPSKYLYSSDLRRKISVETLHGNKLEIKEQDNVLQLGEAHILLPAIVAANAVIFPVDKVMRARRKAIKSTIN